MWKGLTEWAERCQIPQLCRADVVSCHKAAAIRTERHCVNSTGLRDWWMEESSRCCIPKADVAILSPRQDGLTVRAESQGRVWLFLDERRSDGPAAVCVPPLHTTIAVVGQQHLAVGTDGHGSRKDPAGQAPPRNWRAAMSQSCAEPSSRELMIAFPSGLNTAGPMAQSRNVARRPRARSASQSRAVLSLLTVSIVLPSG